MTLAMPKADIAARFSLAAGRYARHARLQQCSADRVLELLRPEGMVLDLGCGTGREALLMSNMPAVERVLALDLAEGMLQNIPASIRITPVAADAERLPLPAQSVDVLFSNFALQWCADRVRAAGEMRRVLKPGGRLAFAVPGPQSLAALRVADLHINRFVAAADWVEVLRGAGFHHVAWSSELLTEYFPDVRELLHALKAIGANTRDERRTGVGLKGRAWLRDISARLEAHRQPQGLPFSYEVLYISASV